MLSYFHDLQVILSHILFIDLDFLLEKYENSLAT